MNPKAVAGISGQGLFEHAATVLVGAQLPSCNPHLCRRAVLFPA